MNKHLLYNNKRNCALHIKLEGGDRNRYGLKNIFCIFKSSNK